MTRLDRIRQLERIADTLPETPHRARVDHAIGVAEAAIMLGLDGPALDELIVHAMLSVWGICDDEEKVA